jgi:hypothetical protein
MKHARRHVGDLRQGVAVRWFDAVCGQSIRASLGARDVQQVADRRQKMHDAFVSVACLPAIVPQREYLDGPDPVEMDNGGGAPCFDVACRTSR